MIMAIKVFLPICKSPSAIILSPEFALMGDVGIERETLTIYGEIAFWEGSQKVATSDP